MPKEFAFATFLVFTTSMLNAQTTLTASEHAPRAGDSLTVTLLSTLPTIQTGRDALWDFSEAAMLGSHAVTFTGTDTVSAEEGGTVWRTALRNDTVLLTGFENRHTLMEFDTPLPLLRYPFSLGDSIAGRFNGKGTWCGCYFMRVWGDGYTRVDGKGTLVIPGGDTLRHVLMVRNVRRAFHHIFNSIHTWDKLVHAAAHDNSGSFPDTLETAPVITDIRMWYAPGWRYPVLWSERTSKGTSASERVFLFPPESQMELACDMENECVRIPAAPQDPPDGAGAGRTKAITGHNISTDSQKREVTASFTLSQPAEVSLSISDVSGISWRSVTRSYGTEGDYTVKVSYDGLPHGQYTVRFRCGLESFTEKFSVK